MENEPEAKPRAIGRSRLLSTTWNYSRDIQTFSDIQNLNTPFT